LDNVGGDVSKRMRMTPSGDAISSEETAMISDSLGQSSQAQAVRDHPMQDVVEEAKHLDNEQSTQVEILLARVCILLDHFLGFS
jgi:hypothetical protein